MLLSRGLASQGPLSSGTVEDTMSHHRSGALAGALDPLAGRTAERMHEEGTGGAELDSMTLRACRRWRLLCSRQRRCPNLGSVALPTHLHKRQLWPTGQRQSREPGNRNAPEDSGGQRSGSNTSSESGGGNCHFENVSENWRMLGGTLPPEGPYRVPDHDGVRHLVE